MFSVVRALTALGLLLRGVNGGGYDHVQTTVTDTIVEYVTRYVDVTVYNTKTDVVCITEYTTTTLHYTVSVTQTNSATVTTTETDYATVTNTETDSVTITNTDYATITNTETDSVTITDTDSITITDTDYATITNTETDSTTVTTTGTVPTTITTTGTVPTTVTTTDTVPATITTFTTEVQTIFSTTYDPCPTSCSISAERVNLYFWPTNRPYTYPSTYVEEVRGLGAYTFTSPSVYMFIPTAVGTNTAGEHVGPSTANWMLPLELYEVSTIATAAGNATRQLTLADLGTKCPKTFDPTAIATLGGSSACDPMLAAPTQVRSWAYPCNACGKFGLFDPPYAVPTITGSLVVPTTTIPPAPPVTVTAIPTATVPPPPPPPGTGQIFIVYCDERGRPFGTATVPAPGVSGSITSSVTVPGQCAATSTAVSLTSSVSATSTASVPTAGAARYARGDGLAKWAVPGAAAALAWL